MVKHIGGQCSDAGHGSAETKSVPRRPSLDRLPPPVEKYLHLVLQDRRRIVGLARFTQTGDLRTDVTSAHWMRFYAEEIVAPSSVGFQWDARVRIAPLLHLRVRDSYVSDEGAGRVSLLSAFTVSDERGGTFLNSGELYRYLAEAVWYPTALVPREELRWKAIDANKAQAVLTHAGVTVSLDFVFNDTGEVTAVSTPSRYARVGKGYESRPWEGHFRRYEEGTACGICHRR